jgi:hypothetical protein
MSQHSLSLRCLSECSLSEWRAAALRLARCLRVQGPLRSCVLVCVLLLTAARSSLAADGGEEPLCDPDVLTSGGQIECELPPPLAGAPRAGAELPLDSGEAPMCDETGASIGAQLQIPEIDGGRIESLPCEALFALFREKLLDFPRARVQQGERKAPVEPIERTLVRAEGARELALPSPAQAEAQLLPAARVRGLARSAGHHRAPYRPPLARG